MAEYADPQGRRIRLNAAGRGIALLDLTPDDFYKRSRGTSLVCSGGHRVQIIRGDHPALTYRSRPLPASARVGWCNCGQIAVADGGDYNASQNAVEWWADVHIRHSPHHVDNEKWTRRDGWVPRAETNTGPRSEEREREMRLTDQASPAWVLRMRRDEIELELARLSALPKEPDPFESDDEPNVIWFQKSFVSTGGPTVFTYAAVRCDDGLWYTTGPKAPKGYIWERLAEWIQEGSPGPVRIWSATEWTEL